MALHGGLSIERAGGAIRLTGFLDKHTSDLAADVLGSRFNATGPSWDFPLSMSTYHELRRVFDKIPFGRVLQEWAALSEASASALAALAGLDDAELAHVSDRIWVAMAERRYQRVAAAFIADAGSCLIADQPGLGKTIELLAGLQEANPDVETRWHLVFAPVVAIEAVWPGEIEHWCGPESAVAVKVQGPSAQRHETLAKALSVAYSGHDVYVLCNLEMARIRPERNHKGKDEYHVRNALYPELFDREWDTIVVDESHRALIKANSKPTQTRIGFTKLRSKHRVALSGTPMRGKPTQLWGTLNWLRPDIYTSYWRWVAQYWDIGSNRFSRYVLGDFLPGGEDRLAADLAPIMLRRTKAEVLPELPPKQYAGTYLIPGDAESPHGIWLTMTPAQRERYERFVKDGTVELPGGWLIANGALAERTRRLQLCASTGSLVAGNYRHALPSPKFDWLVEFLDTLGINGTDDESTERVIVSSYSTDLLNTFVDGLAALGIRTWCLTGETSGPDRARMQVDFQSENPSARVFLLNAKAGGTALTLDMADYLVMLDESTIPDDDEQVEDRAHRTSRLHQLTVYKLRILDTIEHEVAWVAAARESVQRYILDGARGVDYARSLYLAHRQESEGRPAHNASES